MGNFELFSSFDWPKKSFSTIAAMNKFLRSLVQTSVKLVQQESRGFSTGVARKTSAKLMDPPILQKTPKPVSVKPDATALKKPSFELSFTVPPNIYNYNNPMYVHNCPLL